MPEIILRSPNRGRSTLSDLDEGYTLFCCHIRFWAMGVAILETISLAINLGFFIRDSSNLETRIVSAVLWAIVLALLFYGMKKERPYFLIPHLVMQCLQIIGFIILAIAALSASTETFFAIVGAISIIGAVTEIFFFWVILQTLKYYKEKRALAPLNCEIPAVNIGITGPGVSNPAFYGSHSMQQGFYGPPQPYNSVPFPVGGPDMKVETVFTVPTAPYLATPQSQSFDEKMKI